MLVTIFQILDKRMLGTISFTAKSIIRHCRHRSRLSHVFSMMAIQVLPAPDDTAVDTCYVNPPLLPSQHWTGCAQLEAGLKAAGFRDVKAEVHEIGFDVEKEGFMQFFRDSGNPMAVDRQSSFEGDLTKAWIEMGRLLDEGGWKILRYYRLLWLWDVN
ncbi:MAG: hypothetical protein Q9167_005066 [Letrouitia subvulpina]